MIVALAIALAGMLLGGCQGASASFPYDRQTVWEAARGETVVWGTGSLIDDENYRVECTRSDIMVGRYVEYWMEVKPDHLRLPGSAGSRVTVSMKQTTAGQVVRLEDKEHAFLRGLAAKLEATVGPPK